MALTLVALLLAAPIDCPPAGSAARDRLHLAGEVCKDDPPLNPKPPAYAERPISSTDKAAIISKADLLLFDGPSARWQWGPRKDADLYCGFVNARNRMGAYVGWTPFYYYNGEVRIIGPTDSRVVYEALCGAAGYID